MSPRHHAQHRQPPRLGQSLHLSCVPLDCPLPPNYLHPNNSHPTTTTTTTTAKIIAWIVNSLQSPQNQHSHKSAVLFLICSVLWLRDLLSACVLLCMLTMFSIMLFMLVVLGLDPAMTFTPDAHALGLRAWTVSPPTGREDLADQWTPEMARIMAFIYEEDG
ncbi:hypothetical protein BO99DRAFT_449506 [Aspergillus violaceofuscus CBS 115571]|uniref:Uncharacterized protein n=1 Tax=Aspergillus violaceofuscus (strain CBS 115571) TaxID=1450538 RepID=A0A2V5GZD2_ASPV1|nr:hypothetical protein BO99DRAFT_449506 [Aspergillus violaceofuscus CBS 115571]